MEGWLNSPLIYRNWRLNGRIVLSPINTGFARAGIPTNDFIKFHSDRAGPPIAITYVGNVVPNINAAPNTNTVVLDRATNQLREVATCIESAGSLPGIQLGNSPALSPRRNWRQYDKQPELERLTRLIASLKRSDLERSFSDLIAAVSTVAGLGFKVIQLHAAHGYLLSLLLNSHLNRRRDDYAAGGAAFEGLLHRAREAAGNRLLALRFNLVSGVASELQELEDADALGRIACDCGVDILDLSAGIYTVDRRLIYPGSIGSGMPYLANGVRFARGHDRAIVTISGNLTDTRRVEELPANILLGTARALIADPGFARKSSREEHDAIQRCARTNRCHYFSRQRHALECGVNPNISNGGSIA